MFHYYIKRWSKESISEKFRITKLTISKFISNFKKLVKFNDKQISKLSKKRTKFNDDHVEWINDYVKSKEKEHYTIHMVMHTFNDHFGDT